MSRHIDPSQEATPIVSHRVASALVELLANRRRFRREGVALMSGDRDARVRLPIDSRREIYVRPAHRGEVRKPTFLELVFERLFVL